MDEVKLNSIFSVYLGVEDLRVVLNSEWSSRNASYREKIRKAIAHWLGERCGRDISSVADLATLPEADGYSLSVSHCKETGGFAVSSDRQFLGFDVEVNRRLKGVRFHLVSFEEGEWREAPTSAAFWTGKEAAFKCLKGPEQPAGLKDLRVGRWASIESNVHRFEVTRVGSRDVRGMRGLVVDDGELSYAVCVKERGERQDALVID